MYLALEDMVIFQFSEKGLQLEYINSMKNQDINFINRIKKDSCLSRKAH